MKINDIIKRQRKQLSLTQEQVAQYLGVSIAAVSKWESGHTYPDITLLPPLARLLKVDLNTLLSFNEELTDQEIAVFVNELSQKVGNIPFSDIMEEAREKIREYPNCDRLICNVAMTIDGVLAMDPKADKTIYQKEIDQLYERLLKSEDLIICHQVLALLINKYITGGELEKAEALLNEIPDRIVDKTRIQANLLIQKKEYLKAAEILEKKMLSFAENLRDTQLTLLTVKKELKEWESMERIKEVSKQTIALYELWEYGSSLVDMQYGILRKDVVSTLKGLKGLLKSIKHPWSIKDSILYPHVPTKKSEEAGLPEYYLKSFVDEIKQEESLEFLHGNEEFEKLLDQDQ